MEIFKTNFLKTVLIFVIWFVVCYYFVTDFGRPLLWRYLFIGIQEEVILVFSSAFFLTSLTRIILGFTTFFDKVIVFSYYLFILFIFFFYRVYLGEYLINLNPLSTISDMKNYGFFEWIVFLFNLIFFIPLPILLSNTFVKEKKKVFILSVSIVISVELLQLITKRGIFDIMDLFLYFIGIVLGFIINDYLLDKPLIFFQKDE